MAAGNPIGMRAWRTQRCSCLCSSDFLCRRQTRLSLKPNGNIRYQLKTPYHDGTKHVIFKPLDFLVRLAILVPKPARQSASISLRVCSQQRVPRMA